MLVIFNLEINKSCNNSVGERGLFVTTLPKHTLKTVCNVFNRLKKLFYRCSNSDVCSMLKQIEEMFGDKLCPPSNAETVGY